MQGLVQHPCSQAPRGRAPGYVLLWSRHSLSMHEQPSACARQPVPPWRCGRQAGPRHGAHGAGTSCVEPPGNTPCRARCGTLTRWSGWEQHVASHHSCTAHMRAVQRRAAWGTRRSRRVALHAGDGGGGGGWGRAAEEREAEAEALGAGERLVCVLAMALPAMEGMLRLTALALSHCRHAVLELGAWSWVRGEAASAALRDGAAVPPNSDLSTYVEMLRWSHRMYHKLEEAAGSLAPVLQPARLPGFVQDAAVAGTGPASAAAAAVTTATAAAAAAAVGAKRGASSLDLLPLPSLAADPSTALHIAGQAPPVPLPWLEAGVTLAWLVLTLAWAVGHPWLAAVQEGRPHREEPVADGGGAGGLLAAPRRSSKAVAAICLASLMLRVSWAPQVAASSAELTSKVYPPAALALTLATTGLALGAILKVSLFPPGPGAALSSATSQLVSFTQGLARCHVKLVQADLLMVALSGAMGPGIMLSLVAVYMVWCTVLVWLQWLLQQLMGGGTAAEGLM